jgi:hypothetical protein
MTEQRNWVPKGVDITVPSAARAYDAFLGGAHNFEADRAFARKAEEVFPGVALACSANRAFLRRAVLYGLGAGIRQFLDIGSGIPTVAPLPDLRSGSRICSVTSTSSSRARSSSRNGGRTGARSTTRRTTSSSAASRSSRAEVVTTLALTLGNSGISHPPAKGADQRWRGGHQGNPPQRTGNGIRGADPEQVRHEPATERTERDQSPAEHPVDAVDPAQ